MKETSALAPELEISLLSNAIYWFLEAVYIIKLPPAAGYRLVVFHHGNIFYDECYETIRGAKIAFSKVYSYKAWKEGVKPNWSHLYDPDTGWLDDRFPENVKAA